MAIEKTYLLGKNITLGCGFDLQAKAPLDSRQVVPEYDGLQALIDGNAAYEGMIVYDEGTKKTYQAQLVDGVLKFREFGINEAELKELIASETTAAMEFKGAATALPENPSKGDFYKVTASFEVAEGETAKVGDSIVYDGEQWFLIPSGDDIEDTWRPVTDVNNDATLTFVAGDKLEKTVAADGTITYKHAAVDAPELLAENEQTRTYITEVTTDGFGHITGYKTATENVEDTNTTYTFEGLPVGEDQEAPSSVYFQVKSSDEEAAEVIYLDAYTKNEADVELAKKLDKDTYETYIAGKSMSDEELKQYADGLDEAMDTRVKVLEAIDHEAYKAADAELAEAIENAKADANNKAAVVLAEAQAYADGKDAAIQAAQKAADDAQVDIDAYKASNDEALAGVKATAEAAATKEYADAELAKKVDAVEGKSLIDDSEIARLKEVDNYDDTQVKADIAKKADTEAMTTALAGKVDVEEGKSLISTAEIARLAEVDNYDDEEVRGLIGDNAKAIEDLEGYVGTFTHATAKTVVEYINAKTDGIATSGNLEALADRVTANEGDIATIKGDYLKAADIADFETKDNVKKVADDLAAYVASNDAALAAETKARTDADAGFETRIAALEGNFGDGEGTVEAQIAAAVKAEEDARKEAVKGVQDEVDAVEGRMDTAEGKIAALETESAKHAIKTEVEEALALKADKSIVDAMYTNTQIDTAVQGAKDYAKGLVDAIPAQTDYTVTITETTDGLASDIAKKYTFTQNGTEIGSINLAKELVVTAGSVKEATEADKPYAGAKVGDKYIELVIANQEAPIYVPAKDLVDIYTAKDGATEVQIAISNINEISATLVNGGITEEKLAEGVKTKLNKVWEEVGVAKDYTDSEIEKLALGTMSKEAAADYTKTADLGDLATKDSINKITTDDAYGAEITVGYEEEYRIGRVEITDKANSSQKVILDVQGNISVIEGANPGNPTGVVKSGVIAVVGDVTAAEGRASADATSKANTAEANAKAYADGLAEELSAAVEDAKTDASNKVAVALAEAQAYADQAEADAIAAAEGKVNELASNVYTKEEVYTKAQVESILCWGEF